MRNTPSKNHFHRYCQYTLAMLIGVLFVMPQITFSQYASIKTDKDKMLIGEQVALTFTVTAPDNQTPSIQKWFQFADSSQHWELVNASAIDTLYLQGKIAGWQQTWYITSFDTGKLVLPSFTAMVNQHTISSQSSEIEVLPVDVSKLQNYHPLKDIEIVEKPTNWILISAGLGSLILMTILFFLIFKRKKNKRKVVDVNTENWEQAIRKIYLLYEQDKLLEFVAQNYLYSKKILGVFIGMNTHSLTTDELMIAMDASKLDKSIASNYWQFLRLADAIKFAGYVPDKKELTNTTNDLIVFLKHASLILKTN